MSGLQTLALAAVFAFLGGAVAYFVGERADRAPGAASVDVGFLQDMIHHHQQAVAMSLTQVDNGSTGGAGIFAREILYFQSYEIGLMDRQLRDWGFSIDQRPEQAMTWMGMGMGMEPDAMPGMASPEELDALRNSDEAADVDALFLALMRDHHLGGIAMAEYAAQNAEDPWVRDLAARMARNQKSEVAEMDQVRDRDGLPSDPTGYVPDPAVGEPMREHADDGG
ncbi:MAG: DUF305 domain-containing protein [Acidimicrobiales bacterium]|nr:DUF305 domain-containing protein [Acidimicrobiales bacterium]